MYLKIKFVNFCFDEQPGYFEGTFLDAFGKEYIIFEKIPIIFESFNETEFPQEGFLIPGEIKEKKDGFLLFDTQKPYGIETVDGKTSFYVLPNQLSEQKRIIR